MLVNTIQRPQNSREVRSRTQCTQHSTGHMASTPRRGAITTPVGTVYFKAKWDFKISQAQVLFLCTQPRNPPNEASSNTALLSLCLSISCCCFCWFFKKRKFWLHWLFVAAHEPSLTGVRRGHSPVAACGFLTAVVSLVAARTVSGTQAQELWRGLSSCSSKA